MSTSTADTQPIQMTPPVPAKKFLSKVTPSGLTEVAWSEDKSTLFMEPYPQTPQELEAAYAVFNAAEPTSVVIKH